MSGWTVMPLRGKSVLKRLILSHWNYGTDRTGKTIILQP